MANASARRHSLVVPGSIVFGQEKVPFSKRLVSTHKPVPSQYRILIRVCRRLQKTKSAPLLGSSLRRSVTALNSPLKPLRMSQGSTATNTLRLPEKLNMASPGREPRPPRARLGWLHGFPIAHRLATSPPRSKSTVQAPPLLPISAPQTSAPVVSFDDNAKATLRRSNTSDHFAGRTGQRTTRCVQTRPG